MLGPVRGAGRRERHGARRARRRRRHDPVALPSGEEPVRYIGIDTPESVKPGSPVECFAKRASAFNERLVAGERVRLVRDVEERDRYGRLLAYVYRVRDGLFVNAELVRRGYATVATFPPNVAHERTSGGSPSAPVCPDADFGRSAWVWAE